MTATIRCVQLDEKLPKMLKCNSLNILTSILFQSFTLVYNVRQNEVILVCACSGELLSISWGDDWGVAWSSLAALWPSLAHARWQEKPHLAPENMEGTSVIIALKIVRRSPPRRSPPPTFIFRLLKCDTHRRCSPFSKICICIGYLLPTNVECCSVGGCLCALRAQGWGMNILQCCGWWMSGVVNVRDGECQR